MPTPTLNRPTRPSPPARLPRGALTRTARAAEVLRGLAAAVVLLAVVGGVPLALVALVGNPLPTTVPSRSWLDAELSASALLDVLAAVLWLVWGHFVVCVVAEARTWARGGAAGRVPRGGTNQLLAQRLVAAVLLLAAGAVWVPDAATVLHVQPVGASTSTAAAAQAGAEVGAARGAPAPAPGAVAAPGAPDASWAAPAASGADAPAGLVGYLVQPPHGRHHDCLWDIAERTLGDPLRYQEIFDLNRDRVQPDGSRLVDADLIRPGWTLVLPADASAGTPLLPPAPAGAAPALDRGQPGDPAPAPVGDAVHDATREAPQDDLLGRGALSAGLVAVGLLTATRRPRTAAVLPPERGLDDPDRARFLDVALRRLAAAADAAGAALPDLLAARLGADHLVLHLAEVPAGFAAPGPFVADGRSWSVDRRALEADVLSTSSADGAPAGGGGRPVAPYPALADVARLGEVDLLVDLEAAPGLVALGGDAATARALALSVAAELALNPWSDGVHVHLVGFAAPHAGLAPQFVEDVRSLADLLHRLEAEAAEHRRTAQALGVDGVLQGRRGRDATRPRPHVVVLSGPPSAADAARLDALVAVGRTPFAVLVVGDDATARWRFRCAADGSVDLGVLGVGGQAFALTEEGYAEIARLIGGAPTA